MTTGYRVSAQDIIDCAIEILDTHGWARSAYPHHGPCPRCIRAALRDSWTHLCGNDPRAEGNSLLEATRWVSEAIYGRGVIGGIMEWEYHKRTDKAAVLEMLRKASDLAGSGAPRPGTVKHSAEYPRLDGA